MFAVLAIGLTQVLTPDEATSTAAPAGSNAISIKNFAFVPPTITAAAGATVVVVNNDQTAHTVTASDKSFNTGDLGGGAKTTNGS